MRLVPKSNGTEGDNFPLVNFQIVKTALVILGRFSKNENNIANETIFPIDKMIMKSNFYLLFYQKDYGLKCLSTANGQSHCLPRK